MRIAIIGPEASGKTELAQSLALHFHGTATEEYARRYFAVHALPADYALSKEEMREVMSQQHAIEQGEGLCFIDASCIHGPLYAAMTRDAQDNLAFDFSSTDGKIMDYAVQGGYDAFVLCRPHRDLAWIDDGMRAMPDLAERDAFADACSAFIGQHYAGKPCIVVDAATWDARDKQAIAGLKKEIGL